MEECYTLGKENPRKEANIFSRLCFAWMTNICYISSSRRLELKDLHKNRKQDQSAILADHFEKLWDEEVNMVKMRDKPTSLLRVVFRAFFWKFTAYGVLTFLDIVVIRGIQPILVSFLVRCFASEKYTAKDIIYYGGGLCLLSLASAFMNNHCTYASNIIGMRLRIALSSLIYRKVLRLSQFSLANTTAGQVINLLSNDVTRFDIMIFTLHYLWVGPIHLLTVSYLMWTQIGTSAAAGIISLLILTLPVQMLLGNITAQYRKEVAKNTDQRVMRMTEILTGIQVIKMYVWEKPLEYIIESARNEELKSLTKTSYVRAVLVSLMCIVQRTALAITIICYIVLGRNLQADLVFSTSLFLNMLQLTTALMFPIAISTGAECLVSISRIHKFLMMEEKQSFKVYLSEDKNIHMKHAEASWVAGTPTLKDLSLKIPFGSLCAVVGPVGSGKSSFLKLLLGELISSGGCLELSGTISYASQEPWLFTSTVQNNILFGKEYNRDHYENVVNICALEKDFEQFPAGDKTIVGERGVSLSGGQRSRINLARAVYQDSNIYLLDDPLSAVDTKVGRHLFENCISGYLKNKTRILVTHQLQYLKSADLIIVLNKGGIEAQGTFDELMQYDLNFTNMLSADDDNEVSSDSALIPVGSTPLVELKIFSPDKLNQLQEKMKYTEQILHVEVSPFWSYIKYCGNVPHNLLVVTLIILCQVLASATDYFITFWAGQEETRFKINLDLPLITSPDIGYVIQNTTAPITKFSRSIFNRYIDQFIINGHQHIFLKTHVFLYIYILLVVMTIIVALVRSFLYFYSCMKGSKNLHNTMFHCLLEVPMRFFDTTPSGRILNIFSRDMGAIDEFLPKTMMEGTQILLIMFGIIVIVIILNPYMLVVLAILATVYFKGRRYYVNTPKAIKHIESTAKSPIFSYVNSTIDGLITIRSTKNEKLLMKQFDEHQDVHTSAFYLTVACSAAFGLWLDLLCVGFLCTVILGFVVLDQYVPVGASFVGLAISQSLIMKGMLQFGIRQVTQAINCLANVERGLEYAKLDKEHPLETPKDQKPPESWPSRGVIQFQNVSLRYGVSEPLVLSNLDIKIKATEKIGIIGRTGAGKSSLVTVLFRLAPFEGNIYIDGIDTKTLGLRDLRRKISIIPQSAVLFSGTVRYNLDPCNEFEDDELWSALEEVELKDDIKTLDFMVTEGGNNFSVGQRQLICLARAILKNNRILILDEATANVDPRTDELIQKTIREKFKNCTVLTIAHRLNTIMDSDKVLVMDGGRKVEFDHPHILLQDTEGHFTKMVEQNGPSMTQILKNIARDSYKLKEQS